MRNETLRSFAARAFRAKMEGLGFDSIELYETALLRRESAADATEPGHSLPSVQEVLETAVAISEDPALAIRIGQDLDIAEYGAYGFAIMSCPNIGAALDLFLRYGQTLLPSSSWQRMDHDDGLIIRLDQHTGTSYQKMLVTELAFSQLHAHSKLLAALPTQGVRIHFDYPRPAHVAAYKKISSFPMEFGQEYTEIVLPHRWLSQRVSTGDPRTNVLFTQQCEEILQGMTEVKETSAAVRRLLIHSASNFPSISEVADQMHLTERTLRRRLAAEASDYRTIFDDVRNTLAQKYLSRTSLSVVEIADLLDYTEAANFNRAFKRWNSKTPSEHRRQVSL